MTVGPNLQFTIPIHPKYSASKNFVKSLFMFITVMMAAVNDRNTFLIGASNFLTQFLPAGPFLPAGGGQECHMAP